MSTQDQIRTTKKRFQGWAMLVLVAAVAVGAWLRPAPGSAQTGEDATFRRAVALLEQGEQNLDLDALQEAERLFDQECRGASRDALCEYYLARIYLAEYSYWLQVKGDQDRANQALAKAENAGRRALIRRPNDPEVHVLMGKIYFARLSQSPVSSIASSLVGGQSPVVSEYTRALELDPNNGEAELGLGIYYLFIPPFLGGDGHRARQHFWRAQELMPHNPEPLVWVTISYRQDGRLPEARKALNRAIEINPDHPFVQAEAARLREAEQRQGQK